jgi:hypothetical protein
MLERVCGHSLLDTELLVITKACNYVLKPGDSYQGTRDLGGDVKELEEEKERGKS